MTMVAPFAYNESHIWFCVTDTVLFFENLLFTWWLNFKLVDVIVWEGKKINWVESDMVQTMDSSQE